MFRALQHTRRFSFLLRASVVGGVCLPSTFFSQATCTTAAKPVKQFVRDPPSITLYQYEVCPFCNKVRAYLDYYKIPYRTVEVEPLLKQELKFTDYKKVPLAVVNGKELRDSSTIVSQIHRLCFATNLESTGEVDFSVIDGETEESAKWRKWVDDDFIHTVAPNLYRSWGEAVRSFDYITQNSKFNRFHALASKYIGAGVMWAISGKLKKKYGIEDEREAIISSVDKFIISLNGRKFQGGSEPNLADLSVFGVLRALKSFDVFADLKEKSAMLRWYQDMEVAVGDSSRVQLE